MPAGPDLTLEHSLQAAGFGAIAGLDEAGRGAWAGPLVAAAVVLPLDDPLRLAALAGVRDSKALAPAARSRCDHAIRAAARGVAVGEATVAEVEALGPLRASRLAMARALQSLATAPEFLLIDYLCLPEAEQPQAGLPHGDARVLSIAAASIVAKVARDRRMLTLAQRFPGYGFDCHKGYGTPAHRAALARLGVSPIHRRTYAPVAALLA